MICDANASITNAKYVVKLIDALFRGWNDKKHPTCMLIKQNFLLKLK